MEMEVVVVVGDRYGGDGGAETMQPVACSGGGTAIASGGRLTLTVAPMGRVRVLGFGRDCSSLTVEEVGGRRLARRWAVAPPQPRVGGPRGGGAVGGRRRVGKKLSTA
jgi:hypothetical protein